jgi:hypothetical protein
VGTTAEVLAGEVANGAQAAESTLPPVGARSPGQTEELASSEVPSGGGPRRGDGLSDPGQLTAQEPSYKGPGAPSADPAPAPKSSQEALREAVERQQEAIAKWGAYLRGQIKGLDGRLDALRVAKAQLENALKQVELSKASRKPAMGLRGPEPEGAKAQAESKKLREMIAERAGQIANLEGERNELLKELNDLYDPPATIGPPAGSGAAWKAEYDRRKEYYNSLRQSGMPGWKVALIEFSDDLVRIFGPEGETLRNAIESLGGAGIKPGGPGMAPLPRRRTGPRPKAVLKAQKAQEGLLKNQQKQIKEAIENAKQGEAGTAKGRVLDEQGRLVQQLGTETLKQIPGATVRENVTIGTGTGSEIDNVVVVVRGGKTAYVESKLTIADANERMINQLTNAVKASKRSDSVFLHVARKPTGKELAKLEKALGSDIYRKINIVSDLTDLVLVHRSELPGGRLIATPAA